MIPCVRYVTEVSRGSAGIQQRFSRDRRPLRSGWNFQERRRMSFSIENLYSKTRGIRYGGHKTQKTLRTENNNRRTCFPRFTPKPLLPHHRALRHWIVTRHFSKQNPFLKFALGQIRAKLGPIKNFHPMGRPLRFFLKMACRFLRAKLETFVKTNLRESINRGLRAPRRTLGRGLLDFLLN